MKNLKLAAVATLTLLLFCQPGFADPLGCKWGARVLNVENGKVSAKLMMMTGSCGTPPMSCENSAQAIPGGASISGECTSKPFACGTAQETVTLSQAESGLTVGQDIELWIDENGPSLTIPVCE